jgi:threonylcarbamoyladenosine tRNA methylthiotransferase MtaB
MNFTITTFGCKANQYDSDGISELMKRNHISEDSPVHIVNSCTVTENADRKVKSLIARLKRENPECRVILCGCLPKAYPDKAREFGADEVIEGRFSENLPVSIQGNRTRAFLKIQDGCNRSCAYCIIPTARPHLTSRSVADIRAEAEMLVAAGHKEIVITGINLCLYEHGLNNAIEAIAASGVPRIRLGSLEPDLVSLNSELVCNHVHLSLQSGSDSVLRRMNRRYDTAHYRKTAQSFAGCAVTTDIIVGFPGETEDEFTQTLEFAAEMGFAKIHVFPFSLREGTAAAAMPAQVAHGVKQERAARLTALADLLRSAYLKSLAGTEQEVLLEKPDFGHTTCYSPVRLDAPHKKNEIVRVRVTGSSSDSLMELSAVIS